MVFCEAFLDELQELFAYIGLHICVVRRVVPNDIPLSYSGYVLFGLWKNTNAVIEWFKEINNKTDHAFISFDVCDFYPSITKELLTKALTYADKITTITNDDRHIIMHAKQALLFHNDQPWTKKDSTDLFDVTMGSYDGAETCELVGTYLLSLLPDQLKNSVGLYRDDGLAVCNATPRTIESIKNRCVKHLKTIT